MKNMMYLVMLFIFTACAVPDIKEPGVCQSYGVQEKSQSKTVRQIHKETEERVQYMCGKGKAGCVVPNEDGTVDLWWRKGDGCVEIHEKCHAKHGYHHTIAYVQDVIANHPRPACPR